MYLKIQKGGYNERRKLALKLTEMVYSRCGLMNALYRGTKLSFVRHLNDLSRRY